LEVWWRFELRRLVKKGWWSYWPSQGGYYPNVGDQEYTARYRAAMSRLDAEGEDALTEEEWGIILEVERTNMS
jgi:hypothetical protein